MKFTTLYKSLSALALFGVLLSTPVFAQQARNQGTYCQQGGACAGNPGYGGCGMQGAGRGQGRNGGGWGMRGGQRGMGMGNGGNALTASLISPEERVSMQRKMRATTTYAECTTLQTEHRSLLEARAKEKNVTLPPFASNRCEQLKANGLID